MGLWWSWFRDSTFISGTVIVLLCNEALGTSSSLDVEGEASVGRFLVALANVPQSCQQNLPYLCGVRSALTHWLYTVAELLVSAINNLKTMAGGHTVHEWQAILSTTVVISIHFVWRTKSS